MTGFGRGSEKASRGTVTVEIKTLNHKNLNISCLPFEGFFLMEEQLKNLFEKSIIRGKAVVRVLLEDSSGKRASKKFAINKRTADEYIKEAKKLQKSAGLKGEIRISDVLSFPGVIEQVNDRKESKVWADVQKAAKKALKELIAYREKEGAKLSKEFIKRLKIIESNLKAIKKYEKQSIKEYRDKLERRILKATGKKKIDKINLEEEVALFARSCDIAEEICRLEHHIDVFSGILRTATSDVGKKLDFIAQEMHRETNTIGSKAGDYRISNAVIEIKSEIEKIREQVKNIE